MMAILYCILIEEKRIDGKERKRKENEIKKGERNWENKLHKDEIIRNKITLFYNLLNL